VENLKHQLCSDFL
jgi:hypothetical protein